MLTRPHTVPACYPLCHILITFCFLYVSLLSLYHILIRSVFYCVSPWSPCHILIEFCFLLCQLVRHQAIFWYFSNFQILYHPVRISMNFCFFALLWGALIWYRGKASPDVHCCQGSLSPSPLALQKMICFFEVLCVRYVALRSGSVPCTAMLLRLSRPYSYEPRPHAKKHKNSDILTGWRISKN